MNKIVQTIKPLVSINWLHQHIDATNLIILEGTLPKVGIKNSEENVEEFQILNARFFDIKKVFSKQNAPFPNTVLEPNDFENEARKLGIHKDSCIVVYDDHGMYSAPRVWWLFKTFGFENIAVLDGGLPEWKANKYKLELKQLRNYPLGDFEVSYKENRLIDSNAVLSSINNREKQIVDARSLGRFNGTEPEPRDEIRSGHIPTSKNLPHSSLLSNFQLKSKDELKQLFSNINPENKEMIFSCGSGITACVLALGAAVVGNKNMSVYDGSWTEWGSLHHLPIEK
jgi:thiosulfate/3-mercaptopyruvate sulfurtransferase